MFMCTRMGACLFNFEVSISPVIAKLKYESRGSDSSQCLQIKNSENFVLKNIFNCQDNSCLYHVSNYEWKIKIDNVALERM